MPESKPLILVIEDEAPIRVFLRASLVGNGYQVVEAENAQQGLAHATSRPPDLVILDIGLPDLDGFEVTKRLREWATMPILILSARGREVDKVAALDAGADDYLTKPFGVRELLARIRVALRRMATFNSGAAEPVFAVGDLKIDFGARQVLRSGNRISLTPIEYRLLTTLARHAGKVLTHPFLLKEVWGPEREHENHYLRVFMAGLRRKLEDNSARPRYLLTEPSVGYRLAAE